MNLADWARRERVHPQTAYRWFREGTLPVPARRVGPRLILVEVGEERGDGCETVIYARVSSHDQGDGLDAQVGRVAAWATQRRIAVDRVVTEVGSGLNGKRRRLHGLLTDPLVGTIVVEHRDRLARFGVEHLEAALAAQGRRVLVADVAETTDDLVRDMIDVLTSMCARLYGRRGARNRAEKALRCAERDVGPSAVTPLVDDGG